MVLFYADDRIIRSRDPECLQGYISVPIGLFRSIGLMENVATFNTVNFRPETICTGISEEAFNQMVRVEGGI